jgi:hypothetical protein
LSEIDSQGSGARLSEGDDHNSVRSFSNSDGSDSINPEDDQNPNLFNESHPFNQLQQSPFAQGRMLPLGLQTTKPLQK